MGTASLTAPSRRNILPAVHQRRHFGGRADDPNLRPLPRRRMRAVCANPRSVHTPPNGWGGPSHRRNERNRLERLGIDTPSRSTGAKCARRIEGADGHGTTAEGLQPPPLRRSSKAMASGVWAPLHDQMILPCYENSQWTRTDNCAAPPKGSSAVISNVQSKGPLSADAKFIGAGTRYDKKIPLSTYRLSQWGWP